MAKAPIYYQLQHDPVPDPPRGAARARPGGAHVDGQGGWGPPLLAMVVMLAIDGVLALAWFGTAYVLRGH